MPVKKQLFGNNIGADCECCQYSAKSPDGLTVCTVKRVIKDGKCKRFSYNPLLRVPKSENVQIPGFDKSEFLI